MGGEGGLEVHSLLLLTIIPYGLAIVSESGPFKKLASRFIWDVTSVAHPEIFPPILFLLLHHPQYSRDITFAPWRKLGMQIRLVMSICDVKSSFTGYRMRVNSLSRCDAMFPFLLHLGMHDK